MKHDLDCPKCRGNIIKSYNEEAKLRCKMIKWDRNGMFAVCKSCGEDVQIGSELIKSLQSSFVYEIKKD